MGKTGNHKFDFDAEVEAFFTAWPEYRRIIWVPPASPTDDNFLNNDFKNFRTENGLQGFIRPPAASRLFPDQPCVFTPSSNGGNMGILPRWKTLSDVKDLDTFLHIVKADSAEDSRGAHRDPNMWNYFTFDHEMGHLLTDSQLSSPDPMDPDCFAVIISESAADVYGLIRHYQRYGHDSDFPETVLKWRTADLVLDMNQSHYTAPAIKALIEYNREGKLKNLSPEQSVALSIDIARTHFIHADMNRLFEQSFHDLVKGLRTGKKSLNVDLLKDLTRCGTRSKFYPVQDAVLTCLDWIESRFPEKAVKGFDFDAARAKIKTGGRAEKSFLSKVAQKYFGGNIPAAPSAQKPSISSKIKGN